MFETPKTFLLCLVFSKSLAKTSIMLDDGSLAKTNIMLDDGSLAKTSIMLDDGSYTLS